MTPVYSKKFTKKFAKYPPATQRQIHRAILDIPQGDIKVILGKNTPKLYRLRVGKYRVIFYYPDAMHIYLLILDGRGDVYKKM